MVRAARVRYGPSCIADRVVGHSLRQMVEFEGLGDGVEKRGGESQRIKKLRGHRGCVPFHHARGNRRDVPYHPSAKLQQGLVRSKRRTERRQPGFDVGLVAEHHPRLRDDLVSEDANAESLVRDDPSGGGVSEVREQRRSGQGSRGGQRCTGFARQCRKGRETLRFPCGGKGRRCPTRAVRDHSRCLGGSQRPHATHLSAEPIEVLPEAGDHRRRCAHGGSGEGVRAEGKDRRKDGQRWKASSERAVRTDRPLLSSFHSLPRYRPTGRGDHTPNGVPGANHPSRVV